MKKKIDIKDGEKTVSEDFSLNSKHAYSPSQKSSVTDGAVLKFDNTEVVFLCLLFMMLLITSGVSLINLNTQEAIVEETIKQEANNNNIADNNVFLFDNKKPVSEVVG
jgi:hypothetical protein